jgi:hypothetical protein
MEKFSGEYFWKTISVIYEYFTAEIDGKLCIVR